MMRILSLLCFLSSVYATEFLITQKGEEITGSVTRNHSTLFLTKEQMDRCQTLKLALEEGGLDEGINIIPGFESYSTESLSLLFQIPEADEGMHWDIEEIISFLKLLDFCDNKEDLRIWLRKRCKSNKELTFEVIRLLKDRGLGHLVKVFFDGFSMFEVDELGLDRVNFVNDFLPTIKCLSIDQDVIGWIKLHSHVDVEKICNLEEIMFDSPIQPSERDILQKFLGPLTKLKSLLFNGDSGQHQIMGQVINQNMGLESIHLYFTNENNFTSMAEIFGAISSLTRLEELSIEVDRSIPENIFHLAMGNFNFSSLVKLNISLGNSQMQWNGFFAKFQKLEELMVNSTSFGPTELVDFFVGLTAKRLAALTRFVFIGNRLGDIRNGATIGDEFLKFLEANPFLTVVNMSQNNFGELGKIFLSKLSKKNPSIIKKLLFGWNGISLENELYFNLKHFEHLEVLDFRRNLFTDSYFTSLSQSGYTFDKLKVLRLDSRLKGTSLAKFIGLCPNLEKLIIPECGLSSTFIDALSSKDEIFLKLRVLDLGFNKIVSSEKSLNGLIIFLSRFKNLERLILTSILGKVDSGMAVFSAPCPQFVLRKLKFLSIRLNTFDVGALEFILGMIPTPKIFTMWMSNIDEPSTKVFREFLRKGNRTILTPLGNDRMRIASGMLY